MINGYHPDHGPPYILGKGLVKALATDIDPSIKRDCIIG
jgi:hypothetical protein